MRTSDRVCSCRSVVYVLEGFRGEADVLHVDSADPLAAIFAGDLTSDLTKNFISDLTTHPFESITVRSVDLRSVDSIQHGRPTSAQTSTSATTDDQGQVVRRSASGRSPTDGLSFLSRRPRRPRHMQREMTKSHLGRHSCVGLLTCCVGASAHGDLDRDLDTAHNAGPTRKIEGAEVQ
jgi:hypothetical protein